MAPPLPVSPPALPAAQPLLGTGRVRHLRLRPARHGFDYPTWFLLLPMRTLRQQPCAPLHRNGRGWVSFHDADHGDGRADSLAWLDERLLADGVADADGEVWLHTYPRILGFAFKPVSFWYCHRANGTLAAIVAEVNNTFGGRHCYVLHGAGLRWGAELTAGKALQVSPFNRVEGGYRFRFMRTAAQATAPTGATGATAASAGRCVARISYDDGAGPLLLTSVSGDLAPLNARNLRLAVLHMPMLTLGVVLRIHWQALRLALKGVPFVGSRGLPSDAPAVGAVPLAPRPQALPNPPR